MRRGDAGFHCGPYHSSHFPFVRSLPGGRAVEVAVHVLVMAARTFRTEVYALGWGGVDVSTGKSDVRGRKAPQVIRRM